MKGASRSMKAHERSWLARLARVAFMFIVMNWSAVEGLAAVLRGRNVWRA